MMGQEQEEASAGLAALSGTPRPCVPTSGRHVPDKIAKSATVDEKDR